MIEHKEEIFSRPKRTWFVTEKEKKLAAKAAKVEYLLSFWNSLSSYWHYFLFDSGLSERYTSE